MGWWPGRRRGLDQALLQRELIEIIDAETSESIVRSECDRQSSGERAAFMLAYSALVYTVIGCSLAAVLDDEDCDAALGAVAGHLSKYDWWDRLVFQAVWQKLRANWAAMLVSHSPSVEWVDATNAAGLQLKQISKDLEFMLFVSAMFGEVVARAKCAVIRAGGKAA